MTPKRIANLIIGLFLFVSLIFPSLPIAAQGNQLDQPVTLEYSRTSFWTDYLDVFPIVDYEIGENLFLPLFSYEQETQTVVPRLVESYTVSEDGLVYTFLLRADVQWVRFISGEVEPVRSVTAEDAVSVLHRRCQAVDYILEAYRAIQGCNGNPQASGIQVVDETTFTITLTEPASYLPLTLTSPSVAPMPTAPAAGRTVPALEDTVTNGPFVLQSRKVEVDRYTFVFVRNPWLPEDLQGEGNVERVIVHIYEGNYNDMAAGRQFPIDDFNEGRAAFLIESYEVTDTAEENTRLTIPPQVTRIMIFNPDKPPFDNVQVRRAFSAAIDRAQLREVQSGALPAIHFGAPALFGSLPADGPDMLGFDPEYARAQLAEAGYPDCDGLPTITVKVPEYGRYQIDELITHFDSVLGCDESHFDILEVPYDEMYRTVEGDRLGRRLPGQVPLPSNEMRPHLWFFNTDGAPNIPAQATNLGFQLSCASSTWGVPCTSAESYIDYANAEHDPDAQVELWHAAESALFGRDGEFPVAPLTFIQVPGVLLAPWVEGNPITYYDYFGNWSALTLDEQQREEVGSLVVQVPEPGQSVNLNEAVTGTIGEDQPALAFSIPASGEEEINLTVSPAEGSELDPVINVYDGEGNLIAINDDVGLNSRNSRVGSLPGSSDLTVIVSAFNSQSSGDFTLRVGGGALLGTITGDSNANVRSGPGTGFDVVTTAAPGSEVEVSGRNEDASWLKITVDGTEGWLASFLLSVEGDPTGLPIAE